ncbi:hypothetical protein RAA17_02150 [Komagataeibacter rhaeticus]|nr:hypothetical protein [Komagataeibacter rhaeticus]
MFGLDVLIVLMGLVMGRRSYMTPEEIKVRFAREHAMNELRQNLALSAVAATMAGPLTRHTGRAIWNLFRGRGK